MNHLERALLVGVTLVALAACSDDLATDAPDLVDDAVRADVLDTADPAGPAILHDYTRAGGFYAAPFPDESRLSSDGRVDVSDAPNPENIAFVRRVIGMLDGRADGFALSGGIFFALTEPIELPELTVAETLEAGSPVVLVGIDPDAIDLGRRYPVRVAFTDDGGPFGAPNLLSLLPVQGVPLRPRTTYAAAVLRDLPLGRALAPLPESAALRHAAALEALADLGIEPESLAGLAVFTTWDPVAELAAVRDQLLESPVPSPLGALELNEVFDDFCVFEGTIAMPVYQAGEPPFAASGGGWVLEDGRAALQGTEEANLVVTVPRAPMPAGGFPLTVFVRTGGGGERPLVDRGRRAEPGGPAVEPGTGPARELARAGFAGLSIDGPHGGLRNVSGGDEQLLVFNVSNPLALRDNIRQSALEVALTAHIAAALAVDATDCPDLTTPVDGLVRFDAASLGLMGHSMGATIAVPAAAVEPAYGALVLSGAGGSYIENLVHKQSPLPTRAIAENILRYTGTGRELGVHDPVLSLLQWAGEPSDPPVYARFVVQEPTADAAPRHVLMLQGVVDTYILPPIANATSLSLGLDLAGAALDADHPDLREFVGLEDQLDLVGGGVIALPARGNVVVRGVPSTAVVVQHPEDGVEDGHEVVFQTDAPKHQYRCFLQTFRSGRSGGSGLPTVPVGRDAEAPCP